MCDRVKVERLWSTTKDPYIWFYRQIERCFRDPKTYTFYCGQKCKRALLEWVSPPLLEIDANRQQFGVISGDYP
jgi:hypothetical protein